MSTCRSIFLAILVAVTLVACGDQPSKQNPDSAGNDQPASQSSAAPQDVKASLKDRMKKAMDRTVIALRPYHDRPSGMVGFVPGAATNPKTRHPGVAAMAALAYMESYRQYNLSDGPIVRGILDWLVSLQKPDGSIFENDSANYVTSIALSALVAANDSKYDAAIAKARDFIVRLQAREDSGYRPTDKFYGGVGYGGDERPDLSNAQFAIEAVRAANLPQDDPFFRRAVAFLERSQNWSETNDQVWKTADGKEVRPGNDGGAIYLPGESKAGITVNADGTRNFNSYGSMSYALLKSYLFCGLDKNDARVKAVARWCHQNFELDVHPGFLQGKKGNERYQGLFYYYFSMAKCLLVFDQLEIETGSGLKVNWAEAMAEKLLSMQTKDDLWVNDKNGRWRESSELLTTLYGLRALEQCWIALGY